MTSYPQKMADFGTSKPHIQKKGGVWWCGSTMGFSPKQAYSKWKLRVSSGVWLQTYTLTGELPPGVKGA